MIEANDQSMSNIFNGKSDYFLCVNNRRNEALFFSTIYTMKKANGKRKAFLTNFFTHKTNTKMISSFFF